MYSWQRQNIPLLWYNTINYLHFYELGQTFRILLFNVDFLIHYNL